jgi:mannose-6-phosphate isomerase-like protein (cupin superfamily)
MNYSRRDLALLIPALAAAQQPPKGLPSRVFNYDDLPVRVNGENKSRAVMKGETHSAYPIELHMTELGPGQAPHGPHKHVHEELLMLKDGSLDVTISGQTTHVTAGSIVYVASNEMHGWRNPGSGPAQYFVIALGNDAPS